MLKKYSLDKTERGDKNQHNIHILQVTACNIMKYDDCSHVII